LINLSEYFLPIVNVSSFDVRLAFGEEPIKFP
jgi:hypothetical protein